MDPNYAMTKFRMESKDILRSNQKGCWHYLKYFFFFLSIIQFLIILGLVLFMLYGNAHVGTELRLKSVESRYKNLTLDYSRLNDNCSQTNKRNGHLTMELKNCTDILAYRTRLLFNRTMIARPLPPIDACRNIQATLDRINMSCTYERLTSLQNKYQKEREFQNVNDNCTKTINLLTTEKNEAKSVKETLQKQNTDQQSQLKLFQNSCTSINEKFETVLDNLKRNLDMAVGNLNLHDSYQSVTVRCKPLSDTIKNNIDSAIYRMRQDVNTVMLENSQLKVSSERINEDLKHCNQEKDFTIRDKNRLTSEKGDVEKQLTEKTNELFRCSSQYMKKEEDLENCRKPRFPMMNG